VTAVVDNPGVTGKVMGTRVLRVEDPALLTGESRYTDDIVVPGALHVRIVRSSVAHARIVSIDTTAALAEPGVVAVVTGPPAVINAIVDALSHLGVTDITMPATPERVWATMQEAAVTQGDAR
jgi:CO/xanthine dehydrogenase Mo-binding subunit